MTISVLTVGGNNYTAYAALAEADERLAADPVRKATWEALSADDKKIRLVAATRRLDHFSWAGEKAGGSVQELAFPRKNMTHPDGTAVPDNDVPKAVEIATILLAGSIAITAADADIGTSGSNEKRLKAGPAEIEFFRPVDGKALQDETAFEYIKPYLAKGTGGVGQLASGTGESSSFDTGYGLNKGYS